MSREQRQYKRLHGAALKADEAFTVELTRVYGRDAGEARYRYTHDDPGVTAAMRAKLAADHEWWMARVRAGAA